MENEEIVVTPEEETAESEALTEVQEDDIREKITSDLGLSETDDKELVDKLVAKELESRKRLSTAIRQKITYRTKLTGKTAEKPKVNLKPGEFDPEAFRKETEATVKAELEQRDLDEMNYSDTVKAEIKKIAKLNNVSVRKAEKDPYIQHVVEQETKKQAIDEAANNGTRKGKTSIKFDASKPLNPADFDLSSEEGRTAWNEAKKAKREAGH